MVAPQGEGMRRATRVQWAHLTDLTEMRAAGDWAQDNGVQIAYDLLAPALLIRDADGSRLTARLGQWLTRNPDTGEFAVLDDGDEPGQFGWEHRSITGVRNG